MAVTAREKLYEEVIALVSAGAAPVGNGPAFHAANGDMKKIMSRYRVQTKPGIEIPPGATARDALGSRIIAMWQQGLSDLHQKIGTTIDEFRMQMKGAAPAATGAARSKAGRATASDDDDDDGDSPRAPARAEAKPLRVTPFAPTAEVVARPTRAPTVGGAEPVAGGPRKRGKSRGECPKCHSLGVVLARSYSGDEYFSCIYCGWQAYKPVDEDDPNASLAVRLLGQTLPETSRE